jgi:hypothetical protein
MGDVSIPPKDPSRVGAKVDDLIASGHQFYAASVTGNPAGRVRRPTLFVIAAVGAIVGTAFWPGAVISIIAILLLALSDNVVEL